MTLTIQVTEHLKNPLNKSATQNQLFFLGGLKTFEERFEVQLPLIDLNYSYFSKEYDNMIKDVRKFYFSDKPVDANSLQEFVKLLSDVFFIYGIDKSVKAQVARSTGKTFYYQ